MRLPNRSKRFPYALALAVLVFGAPLLGACAPGVDDRPEPGAWLSPLVPLQRLQGANDHLHVDEIRLHGELLLSCSYEFGVVDAGDGGRLRYLSEGLRHDIPDDPRRPGCTHLAAEGSRAYTTHRGNLRNPTFLSGWDLTDPRAPVQLPVLREPGVSYEGVDAVDGRVFVALHENGLGVYTAGPDGALVRTGVAIGLANAWGVRVRDGLAYVADAAGSLAVVDVSQPESPDIVGRVDIGGRPTDVALDGDRAYVASGSAGLAIVDVADPTAPAVIGRAAMPGSAIRVALAGSHAFVAAWNDARVYDVGDPAAPRFVGAVRLTREVDADDADRPAATSRVLGIAARGADVFVGNWHVLYSYRLFPERPAPNLRLPETASLVDAGLVQPGDSSVVPFEVTNQGTAPLTVLRAWVAGSGFSVTPDRFRLQPGERTTLAVEFTPESAEEHRGYLQILSDDPQAPLRSAYLAGNRPGLGVGMLLPETRATLLDGRDWTSTEARGTVTLLAFFATF